MKVLARKKKDLVSKKKKTKGTESSSLPLKPRKQA